MIKVEAMRPNLTRKVAIATIVLVALVASVGVGYAAIPSSDDVIHACYNASANSSGMLRVIDAEAGAKCSKNERPLNFNQTGPQGLQGPAGPPGPAGSLASLSRPGSPRPRLPSRPRRTILTRT